jgi:hypothetical protein
MEPKRKKEITVTEWKDGMERKKDNKSDRPLASHGVILRITVLTGCHFECSDPA